MSLALSAAASALHVIGFGIGLPGIVLRARALSRGDIDAALMADNAWGISALLLWGTGLTRAFGGLEKGSTFYLENPLFHLKIGLVLLIALLEIGPMVILIRCRLQARRGEAPDRSRLPLLARISAVEAALLSLLPFVAAAMARGVGLV